MKKYKYFIAYAAGIGLLFFLFVFFVTASQIGFGVKDVCRTAKSKYRGDCVAALSRLVDDGGNSYKSRNSAVWALGQLGDKRARPVLAKYYRGDPPEKKCNRRKNLCQYELYKALKLVDGGLNISAFAWRDDGYFKNEKL